MSSFHTVEQGEHLSRIAARFGFSSFRTIWYHPQNAEIKKLRKDPNILLPGDRIFIPDRETKELARATEQRHVFVRRVDDLRLRVKVLDQSNTPIQSDCSLVVGATATQMPQRDDIYETAIDVTVEQAMLDFPITPDEKFRPAIDISVGHLDPIGTLHGQQQRLNNLGYFAGFTRKNEPDTQFRWAVEEFQCDHPPLAVDGKVGPNTLTKLEAVHGC